MVNNVKNHSAKAIFLLAALMGSSYANADTVCPEGTSLAPLASDIANGTKNTTICVDQLNNLFANDFVFDIDTPVTKDGTPTGTPSAFSHMFLMGSANRAYINKVALKGTDDSSKFDIIGIIHGSALKWALNDAWWEKQVDDDGNQLYPNGNPYKAWFDKIAALRSTANGKIGMNIHLEVCGVTLEGAGLTRDDVYPGILVNQGAFGRMSSLHQQGYAIVPEGWVDNDKHHGGDRDHDRR